MIFDRKMPLYLKLFTSIEGYVHIFISPIIIYLISKDIRLSGIYFLIEGLVRFSSYTLSGNICEVLNIRKVIRLSYFFRFLFILHSILIYLYYPNKYLFLMINNIGFVISNCMFVTSFEILYQKGNQYNQRIQSLISAGDLISAGIAIFSILLFVYLKINFAYYVIVIPVFFLIGFRLLFLKTKKTFSFKRKTDLKSIVVSVKNNFKELYFVVRGDKFFLLDTVIGYLPFTVLLMLEQFCIYEFSSKYSEEKMQIVYFSMKMTAFLSSSLFIPSITIKMQNEIKKTLWYSIVLFIFGLVFALQREYVFIRILGLLLVTYAHYFVFNYRKIKRRETMIKNKLSFHSLGLFLAIEGLGTVIANFLLSFFGKSYYMLWIVGILFFMVLVFYSLKQYNYLSWGKKKEPKLLS